MTISEMFAQSGVLTILGMGVVFLFLIIMICSISVVCRIINALGKDKNLAAAAAVSPGISGSAKAGEITAAITAAINEYRKDNT